MPILKKYIQFLFLMILSNVCTNLRSETHIELERRKIVKDLKLQFKKFKKSGSKITNFMQIYLEISMIKSNENKIVKSIMTNQNIDLEVILTMDIEKFKICANLLGKFFDTLIENFLELLKNKNIKSKNLVKNINFESNIGNTDNYSIIQKLIENAHVYKNEILANSHSMMQSNINNESVMSKFELENIANRYKYFFLKIVSICNVEGEIILKNFINYFRMSYIELIMELLIDNKKKISCNINSDIRLLNSFFKLANNVYQTQKNIISLPLNYLEYEKVNTLINDIFNLPIDSNSSKELYTWLTLVSENIDLKEEEFNKTITKSIGLSTKNLVEIYENYKKEIQNFILNFQKKKIKERKRRNLKYNIFKYLKKNFLNKIF